MSRQETQVMKGIAILFMIFYHLFLHGADMDLCHSFIFINGIPLAKILTRAMHPVAFYLILGGYGLYKVWQKGDKNRWKRILKLYMHWWIIMIIFVAIGHFIRPAKYPGSISEFILNAIGYQYNYNGELWFLLPYVILSIFAPVLFKLMSKFRALYVVIATLFINLCTSFCISRFGDLYFYKHLWAYQMLLPFHLLFNFSLGAMAARSNWFEKVAKKCGKSLKVNVLSWLAILVLVTINCVFKYNFFYAFLFLTFFSLVRLTPTVSVILGKLGDNSMNMWMIHSWFCYHLFKSFTYSFTYPILIFIVLTIISYVCSLLINRIADPIERLFMSRRQVEEKPIL